MNRLKELLIVIITLCIIPTCLMVQAEEVDKSEEGEIVLLNHVSKQIGETDVTEYVYQANEEKIIVDVIENQMIAYDENYQILATAEFEKTTNDFKTNGIEEDSAIAPAALIDDYDQWNGWRTTDMVNFTPKFINTITVSVLSSLMQTAFKTSNISIRDIAIGALCDAIINTIESGKTVYVKGDYNYNKYCDILRKERVNQYNSSGSVKHYGSAVTNWLNTPWDYTTHAACRVLTQRY